jgi:hypothetical protein
MTNRQWVSIMALVGNLGLLNAQTVRAQVAPGRLAAVKARIERVKAFADGLPQPVRQRLSSSALNLIHLAERWDQIELRLRQVPLVLGRDWEDASPHRC